VGDGDGNLLYASLLRGLRGVAMELETVRRAT
jgi:hypothetical protein